MSKLLSTRQVARALGVSEASLKRWCDRGLLPVIRTAGGHRRLPVHGVIQFLRERGHRVIRPEVLGLPHTYTRSHVLMDRARELLRDAFESGDEVRVRTVVLDLYLSQRTLLEICDDVLTPVFHDIGDRWAHGSVEIYQERLACELAVRILHDLRSYLPSLPPDAPLAIGGTPEGDPYQLATAMAELVLREAGWDARSLGAGHPAHTLCAALRDMRPKLLWVSVSHVIDAGQFLEQWSMLYHASIERGIATIVGGQAMTPDLRQAMAYSACGDHLRHLVSFANTLRAAAVERAPDSDAAPDPGG